MAIATVMLRMGEAYKRPIFEAGLAAMGYQIEYHHLRKPGPDDVLLLWNRTRGYEGAADLYERSGAKVLIAENGYLQQDAEKTFALSLNRHNGAGNWRPCPDPRFAIETLPWRVDGRDILILMQRGIGSAGVAMPGTWLSSIKRRLAAKTKRPIKIRYHPGMKDIPLEPDLGNVWACVTWGSGAGIKALLCGVPVFYDMPVWIGGPGGLWFDHANIEEPFTGDRAPLLTSLSWAQWRESEIASGEAFRHLL